MSRGYWGCYNKKRRFPMGMMVWAVMEISLFRSLSMAQV
ncbi:TPA: transposase domain-containing protein [Providencia stuartii]|nr:transposase domain-containing protein [Providencia stuartii]MBG5908712.1 transposase domain-containing protein [Providencia stuartii]HAU5734364.1 hypothetical protein [Providencia stuartii]HAU5775321.1 hypothetical protein [Providencia stuartii]HEM6895443.1 transposase domain-containing protein [Providencia stuartii]